MPRNTTLNTGRALRQLGVQGGAGLGRLSDLPMQPTVQVADLSQSFISELVEPRILITEQITTSGLVGSQGFHPTFKLRPLAAGGVVIEQLELEAVQLTGVFPAFTPSGWREGSWVLLEETASVPRAVGNVQNAAVLQLGQVPARSTAVWGEDGAGPGSFRVLPPFFKFNPSVRWYVPPGRQLNFDMWSAQAPPPAVPPDNQPVGQVSVVLREILGPL